MDKNETRRDGTPRSSLNKTHFYVLITVLAVTAAIFIAALATGITALVKYSRSKTIIEHRYDSELFQGVVDKYKYNAVELRVGASNYGTAFVYTFDGKDMYLITNYHVSGNESGFISARFYGNNSYYESGYMEILGWNEEYDIAVLKTSTYPDNDYVDIKKESEIVQVAQQGKIILCLGNNLGYGIQAQNGIVSRDSLVKNIYGNVIAVVPVCAPLNSGNSGAAVFDLNGGLVGMNTWKVDENAAGKPVNDTCYLTPAPIVDAVFDNIVKFNYGTEAVLPLIRMGEGDYGTLYIHDMRTTLFFEDFKLKVKSVEALGTRELSAGDVITQFGSIPVTPCSYPAVVGELFRYSAQGNGAPLMLIIERGGAQRTVVIDNLKLL